MTQTVKNPPAMLEIQVRSLGQEDPLEEGMATHSSIVAGKIPWTEEPGGLQSMKTSLNIWKFTVHILLKPGLENFEHYFASM